MKKIHLTSHNLCYDLLFLVITIRYLVPSYIDRIIEQYVLIDCLLLASALSLICLLIITNKNAIKIRILPFCVPCIILIFSTVLNDGDLLSAVVRSVTALLFCVVIEIVINNKSITNNFLYIVRDLTVFFFICNLIVIQMAPEGIIITNPGAPPQHLYGNINSVIRQIFPGLCCSCIIDSQNHKKLSVSTAILIIGMFYNFIAVYFSVTSFLALILIMVWIFGERMISSKARIIYVLFLIFILYFEVVVVIAPEHSMLSGFITAVFHKTILFSGRRTLWTNAWTIFLQKPILGNGVLPKSIIQNVIGNSNGSHNYFLDILYQRGILGLLASLHIILLPILVMKKGRLTGAAYILMGFCCAYILMFLTETFNTEHFVYPMFYALITLLMRGDRNESYQKINQ